MKIKSTIAVLSAIIALAVMPVSSFSQDDGWTVARPDAPTGFSTFSMPQNLGMTVNSADNELLPTPAPSGLSLYFMSNRAGGLGGVDIYVSQRTTLSSAWGSPQNLGAIVNTSGDDGVTGFSPDGRELFIQSTRPGGQGGQDIWLSTRTDPNNDFGWTAPVNLGAVINSPSFDAGGIYFIDPATGTGSLLFYSDRNGTPLVNFNIYQSTRNPNDTFNPPSPVSELNSSAAQIRPAISRDGLEIFISTNRRGPANVFAIHLSSRASTSAPWSPPVYLAGINGSGSNSHPALSPDGSILYFASNRSGGSGLADAYSATRVSVNRSSTADFDGDGRTDLSVFRPSDGTWYILQSSSNTLWSQPFGLTGDKIVPGDYDGDGRTDFAVFRPSDSNWYVLRSSDNSLSVVQWGLIADKLVPGDYDGDGRTDIAVYRDGGWYIVNSSNGSFSYQQFGLSTDIPVAAANAQ